MNEYVKCFTNQIITNSRTIFCFTIIINYLEIILMVYFLSEIIAAFKIDIINKNTKATLLNHGF